MKKPLFLAAIVATSVCAGVVADRNWQRSSVDEGAQCDFIRPARHATARPLAVVPAEPCTGSDASGSATISARPDCPGAASPTAPRAIQAEEDPNTTLIALGALLGLFGLGAVWKQAIRGRRHSRKARAAAFAPVAALAEPITADHAAPGTWQLEIPNPVEPAPPVLDAAAPAFIPAGPSETIVANEQRRSARAARKAGWRRLGWLLLFGGSVAAVAASTSRGFWADDSVTPHEAELHRATANHRVTAHTPEAQGPHGTPAPAQLLPAGAPDMPPSPTGSSGQALDGRGGWSRGVVADTGHSRLPVSREPGERIGAHMFGAGGAGSAIVSDPRHANVEDRVSKSGGGGSSGDGSQGAGSGNNKPDNGGSGGGTGGGARGDGGPSGAGGSGGPGTSDRAGEGGHNPDEGAPHGGSGGGDRNGDGKDNGGSSHDGTPGSDSPGIGSDPGKWLGNDPSHGGSTEVPEPDTIGLLALGIVGLALSRSRRLRQRLRLAKPGQ